MTAARFFDDKNRGKQLFERIWDCKPTLQNLCIRNILLISRLVYGFEDEIGDEPPIHQLPPALCGDIL